MSFLERQGIVHLPIILILAVFLSAIITSIGLKGINQVNTLKRKQTNTQNFNKLLQKITELTYGSLNEKRKICLDIGTDKIKIHNKIAELKNENETIRAEKLPLPLLKNGKNKYAITSGTYQIKLVELEKNSRNYRLGLILSEIPK